MLEEGRLINYYTVAEAANVSRPFLYSHEELRSLIDACRVSGMSKAELKNEVIRLRLRIQELEQKFNNN